MEVETIKPQYNNGTPKSIDCQFANGVSEQ